MSVLSIAAIAGIMTFAALWSKNFLIALVSMSAWVFVGYFALNYPPWGLVAGDPGHQMLLVVLAAFAFGVPGYIILSTGWGGDKPTGFFEDEKPDRGFSVKRFLTNGDIGNRAVPKEHRRTAKEYEAEVDNALHPRRRRR